MLYRHRRYDADGHLVEERTGLHEPFSNPLTDATQDFSQKQEKSRPQAQTPAVPATELAGGWQAYDLDGDGVPDFQDEDLDGDDLLNNVDPDIDGDGVPNRSDPDPYRNHQAERQQRADAGWKYGIYPPVTQQAFLQIKDPVAGPVANRNDWPSELRAMPEGWTVSLSVGGYYEIKDENGRFIGSYYPGSRNFVLPGNDPDGTNQSIDDEWTRTYLNIPIRAGDIGTPYHRTQQEGANAAGGLVGLMVFEVTGSLALELGLGAGGGRVIEVTGELLSKLRRIARNGGEHADEATSILRRYQDKLLINAPERIVTPNPQLRQWAQRGGYIDPRTNKWVVHKGPLAADHVYPKSMIKKLDGFKELTHEQQDFLLNYPGNFEPLPKAWNSSKLNRLADEWANTPMGRQASQDYIDVLRERQEAFAAFARNLIDFWNQ